MAISFPIFILLLWPSVKATPERNLQSLCDTFAKLQKEHREVAGASTAEVSQFAVAYISNSAGDVDLKPDPKSFDKDNMINGENYIASVIDQGERTGAAASGGSIEHTESKILSGMLTKANDFTKKYKTTPNIYFLTFNSPCCTNDDTTQQEICGPRSCSNKIYNFIQDHGSSFDKMYLGWNQIYSGSFKPISQSFFYTMHTILQANKGTEKVILTLKPQGYVPTRRGKNNWKQGSVVECLRRKIPHNVFKDESKFEENVIRMVNKIMWDCATSTKGGKDGEVTDPNCWGSSDLLKQCKKMREQVVECVKAQDFRGKKMGPPLSPVDSTKVSSSVNDLKGMYDISYLQYEQNNCD